MRDTRQSPPPPAVPARHDPVALNQLRDAIRGQAERKDAKAGIRRMRMCAVTCSLLAMMVARPTGAAEKPGLGSIHVRAKPGIVVFIDDQPARISLAGEHGVTIRNVLPGEHTLRMTLAGFRSKTLVVT